MIPGAYNEDTLFRQTKATYLDLPSDREACLFTATVHRKVGESSPKKYEIPEELSIKSGKTSGKILDALRADGNLSIPELASLIGVTGRSIERNIKKLQEQGLLRRIGPAKAGYWEVL